MTAAEIRERVLELVHRHGFNATAFQTLDEGYHYAFFGTDACVAYVETGGGWVVAGAPIAAEERLDEVARAFVELAHASAKRCSFFATETRFVERARGLKTIRLGEQPVWDPSAWDAILSGHKSLREQLRRARAKRVITRQLNAVDLQAGPMRDALEQLARRWFSTRQMAPMGFLVRVAPFTLARYRRCFVAERDGALVAFAGLVPVPARGGWFLEYLVRDPRAPNGTVELLVDAVMRWAAASGCDWLTLGLAPLAGDLPAGLRAARRGTALLYDFEGLRSYKAKLRPQSWSPLFLSYPAEQGPIASLFDVLGAFASGGLLRFAWRSLLRGSTAVLRMLAVLLIPWTLALALVPGARWFAAPWVQWAWVAFDVVLVVALWRATRRPSSAMLTALAIAVSADAILTTVEAMLWNAPRIDSAGDALVLLVACAAPTLAAAVLWGARRRSHGTR